MRGRLLAPTGALVALLLLTAGVDAGEVVVRGSLDVTGTRWVNGVARRVSCRSSAGGFMNAGPTLRLLAVAPTDTCGIVTDGEGLPPSPFGAFRFLGTTRQVTERGRVRRRQIYAAVPSTPGVEGLLVGQLTVDREGRPVAEKGTLIYRRVLDDRVIHFQGKYRSRLRRRR